MNRKSFFWGIAILALAVRVSAIFPPYQFAVVSNSITAGANLNAVANNGNIFVCVGANNSPVLAVNSNNFTAFAANNAGGGYLLFSNAWTNTLKSPIKYNWLNCVAAQPNGFIASGASNSVFVSADGVNWTNRGNVVPGNNSVTIGGIAYSPVSGTFAAAQAIYNASWATNPVSSNGWQDATMNGQSFVESFREVAPFNSNDMAMCGILGDIRISTDGGRSWNVSQQVNEQFPNLLAISSDGGSNLVCAGNFSLLEVSTNGGPNATWTFQTNLNFALSGSVTDFNAVAYNPIQNVFLAAGSIGANGNGFIALAPELAGSAQWPWTRQTNLWQYQNGNLIPLTNIPSALNGAAFADSGFFQGISIIVGGSGMVMIGGYQPEAPFNLSNIDYTNVLANPLSNQALTALVIGGPNNPANVLTVDWYASATGGTPVALNAVAYQPTNDSCGTYTNWAQVRDLRTGLVSSRTPFAFTIIPGAPGNPMSATNCNPIGESFGMCDPTTLSVTVVTNAANPPGAIQVNWYDAGTNLVATTELSPNSDIMGFPGLPQISPLVPGGVFTYYAQATNPATGFVSTNWTAVTYQVNPLPVWTSAIALSTNTYLTNPQVNPQIQNPGVGNLFTQIIPVEPGAVIAYDWYTNGDPTVATFDSPNPPFALTGVPGFPGVVEPASGVISFIPTNVLCGTYTYYVRARVVVSGFTACYCESTNLIPVTFTLSPPPPLDAVANLTNVLSGFNQVNTPIWVDLVTNAANPASNFKVNWYSDDQSSNINNYLGSSTAANSSNRFFFTPNGEQVGFYTNWAETMDIKTGSGIPIVNTNRIPVMYVIIPDAPAPLDVTAVTNCIEIPNPTFTVAVTNGQIANWYTVPSSGTPVAAGTLTFTPTNSSSGTWQFSAQAVDPVSQLVSTGSVLTTLSLYDCTNPVAINLNSTNGTGTIQWPGNLTLLSTTNLTPPVQWTSVSTGSNFSTLNTLTFTNTNPPVQFFRLTN